MDKLIEILKIIRPKFYNKITWTIVIAGIGLLSTSIFEQILNLFLDAQVGITITDESDKYIGMVLIVIGLIYQLICQKIDNHDNKSDTKKIEIHITHDINIYNKLEQCMSEKQLRHFLSSLNNDHCYRSSMSDPIEKFIMEAQQLDNKFLTTEIDESARKLLISATKLIDFVSLNFFVYPENQSYEDTKFCLYPELNIDRGHPNEDQIKRYRDAEEEMNILIKTVGNGFIEYRNIVKTHLMI